MKRGGGYTYLLLVGAAKPPLTHTTLLARSHQLLLLLLSVSAQCSLCSPCSFSSLPPPPSSWDTNAIAAAAAWTVSTALLPAKDQTVTACPNRHWYCHFDSWSTGTRTTQPWRDGCAPLLRCWLLLLLPLQYCTPTRPLCGLVFVGGWPPAPINARRALPAELAAADGGGGGGHPSWPPCPCHACVSERAGQLVGR